MWTVFERRPSLGTYRGGGACRRTTIICYPLTCYQLTCYQPHLLSASLTINSLAISLTCYQTHLLSTQLLSHSFAIKPHLLSGLNCYRHTCYQALLAFRPICYQSSVAINNFAINHHLLSNFRLALNHYFNQFFSKNPQKNGKISQNLEFFSLWQTLRGHGVGSFCSLLSWHISYDNMPLGIYMNNIVRFFKDDWVKI